MSADLFAAFGGPEPDSTKASTTTLEQQSQSPTRQTQSAVHGWYDQNDADDNEDFDDFGDFENADEGFPESQQPAGRNNGSLVDPSGIRHTQNQPATQAASSQPRPEHRALKRGRMRDENVLFDAEDPDEALWQAAAEENEDEDDFGDFEGSAAAAGDKKDHQTAQSELAGDFLGLELGNFSPNITSNPVAPQQSPSIGPKPTAKSTKPIPKVQLSNIASQEDSWDDFETTSTPAPPATKTSASEFPDPEIAVPQTMITTLSQMSNPPPSPSPLRPSTIPPPSILLPLFPSLFSTISKSFLHPLTLLPSASKSSILISSQTTSFLKGYILLATVFAHILAGRNSRWKRDKLLYQSMAIGPSSGRSGGMKLNGLDKGESRREEQEVDLAVVGWRAQVGRARGVVAAFNAAAAGQGKGLGSGMVLPEIAGTMLVRTAKGSEGAVVSSYACALCGLKRDERVAKVDVDVEDSFGEWWIEGTNMHLSCWNFWEAQKESLRSR